MTASFLFAFAAPSSSFNPTFLSPLPFCLYLSLGNLYDLPLFLPIFRSCSLLSPLTPFTILSPLPPPSRIISPLRPLLYAFPLPFIDRPLSPGSHSCPRFIVRGFQGSKQEQFEGDCFPGAVGRADGNSLAFFSFCRGEG